MISPARRPPTPHNLLKRACCKMRRMHKERDQITQGPLCQRGVAQRSCDGGILVYHQRVWSTGIPPPPDGGPPPFDKGGCFLTILWVCAFCPFCNRPRLSKKNLQCWLSHRRAGACSRRNPKGRNYIPRAPCRRRKPTWRVSRCGGRFVNRPYEMG